MNSRKCAIVTGASSGLGRVLVQELAKNGFELALIGRNKSALSDLAASLRSKVAVVEADLAKPSDLIGLVERCRTALGGTEPFSHLVNCAGFAVTGKIEEIPTEAFERCWQVNFSSAVSLSQQVIPEMKRAKTGMIVNVGSGVGLRAIPFTAPYCTAKAALGSFSDSLRVEMAGTGIKVLHFSPGPVTSGFQTASEHYGAKPARVPTFHGQPAENIASKLFTAMVNEKERVVLGTRAMMAHHLNYWSPKLTDLILRKMFRTNE